MAGGTVHLLVLPNTSYFHTKLKNRLEEEQRKIDPLEVKVDVDDRELDFVGRKVDRLDGRTITLKLLVDDTELQEAVRDFEEGGDVHKTLRIDTEEAEADLRSLDHAEDIHRTLNIDYGLAEEEMLDFDDHWGNKKITRKVAFEGMDEATEGFQKMTRTMSGGTPVPGVRNLIPAESDLLDIENFMGRIVRNMNNQFSIGIRQIYDQYITTLTKMWEVGKKPFLDFRQDWNSAKSFSDFFEKIGDRSDRTRRKISKFTGDTKASFRGLAADMRTTGRLIRQTPQEIGNEFKKLGAELSKNGGIFGNIKALMPDFAPLQRQVSLGIRNMGGRIDKDIMSLGRRINESGKVLSRGAFKALGGNLIGSLVDMVLDPNKSLSQAWKSSGDTIEAGFDNIAKKIATGSNNLYQRAKSGLSAIPRAFGDFGKNSVARLAEGGRAVVAGFQNISKNIGDSLRGMVQRFADSTRDFRRAAGMITRVVTAPFRGLARGVGRAFAATTRTIGNGVKRIGSHLGALGRVAGNSVRHFGNAFRKTGAALAPFARAASGVFAAASRSIRFLGSAVGAMRGPFRVVQKVMGRVGNVAMGAARVAMGAFAKLAGMLMSSLLPAIMAVGAGFLAMGGQAIIGAVMALGGALQAVLVGALAMLPAVVGAAAVSFAVLKIGAEGLGTAIKSAFNAETVEDFEKAIADLPPAMQSIARSLRGFKPMWDEMTTNIQANMFGGLDDNFASAVGAMLPIFKSGSEEMALSWNRAFEGALDALSSPQATAGLTEIMRGANEMAREMEPVIGNLIKAAGSLAEQGAKFLGGVGTWAANKSEEWFLGAEGLKEIDPETGQSYFDGIIESAKVNAKFVGDIFGGAFGTLGNVFKAGAEGGAGMLAGMATSMQTLKEYTSEGNEGFEQMVGFMEQATEFGSQLGQIVQPLFSGLVSILTTLASVGSGAVEGAGVLLQDIVDGLAGFEDLAEGFGENLGNIFAAAGPIIESLLIMLQPIIAGLGEGLDKALVPMLDAIDPFLDTLESLGGPIGDLLVTVGEALGKIGAPLITLIGSALTLLEPLIPVLDKVFFWIGEVVGRLLELAEPFFTLRDEAVAGLIDQLNPLVDVLGEGLMGVLDALAPIFPILGALFSDIVEAVTPLIEPLTKIAQVLFMALIDVIKMVMPLFPPIAALIGHLAGVLADVLVAALDWLLRTWNNVWPVVASVLKFVIDNVIVPGIKLASEIIKKFADFVKWAIENIIVPVLNFLSDMFGKVIGVIKWVIENVAQPAIDVLVDAFQKGIDGIKNIWDGLKKIFSAPIKFFIDTVINDGVIEAWNKVMGWIKQDDKKMGRVSSPAEMNFHQGGVLPGMSVGKDNYNFVETRTGARLGLAGGEGIMRQEFVSAVGGKKGIDRLNNDARHGRLRYSGHDPSVGYAQGGVVGAMEEIVRQKYPEMVLTSGWRESNDNHGRGLAADFAWPGAFGPHPAQLSLANDIADTYPGSMELIYGPGFDRQIKNGAIVGDGGGSYGYYAGAGDHSNHVHWAMSTPPTMPFGGGVFEGGSSGAGGGGNFLSQAINWFKEKFSFVTDLFGGVKEKIGNQVAKFGNYGALATGTAKNMLGATSDWAKSKLEELNPFKRGSGGGSGPLGSREEVEMYRDGIIAAFRRQGEEPLDWRVDALLRQIWTESKGDPNVAQQIVDMNGTGESAGVGLYQVIPGTWAGYRDPELPDDRRNVEAAHNFAVRYFRDKHNWNTGPGGVGLEKTGWFTGGVLPSFFDQGGVANGVGHLMKNTIQPERVLSPAQTKAFNDMVYKLMPEMISQFKQNPWELARHFRDLKAGLKEIYTEMREGRIKHVQDGLIDMFRRRRAGENLADNPVDTNIDFDWLKRNQENLEENRDRAARQIGKVYPDPQAYLEAERRAKEQLDKDEEAAKAKAQEEEAKKAEERKEEDAEKRKKLEEQRKKAEEKDDKAKLAEIDAKIDELDKSSEDRFEVARRRLDTAEERTRKEETKDLEAELAKLKKDKASDEEIQKVQDKLDEVNKSVKKNFDEARKVVDDKEKKEEERQRKIEERENERIERAKADGSYYYGYKVFDDEGKNPNEITRSQEETAFRSFMSSASSRVGLGEAFDGLSQTFDDARNIYEASQVAMPAYMAALNGDPSGLAHNIAAGQAAAIGQASTAALDLGPEALAGIVEMAISGSSVRGTSNAPFIGEVNSGMTQAELMQTLEHYEMRRARQGTGTTRVR